MPEGPEIKIMSDFIQKSTNKKTFTKIFTSPKNNNFIEVTDSIVNTEFTINTKASGKELSLYLNDSVLLTFFMGMTGNWKFVKSDDIDKTNWIRVRFDTNDGYSLICYGGYMGPKWTVGKFKGTKRGPDPTINFDLFKANILSNLDKKVFTKPIPEVLLNQEYFNGIGAYLVSEILGRSDINPFRKFNELSNAEIDLLLNLSHTCFNESYSYGGGELMDWSNPFGSSNINSWILFYGNKNKCHKYKFGKRNIWISNKFKLINSF